MRRTVSVFNGVTTPARDLYDQIERHGWTVTKVAWDTKVGAFVAEGQDPYGMKRAKTGPDERTALANLLINIARNNHMRTAAQYKLGMWKTMFTDQLQPIAEAYAKAPVYDPKAATYFKELADDSVRRAHVLGQQLHIEVTDNPEPYPSAQAQADDIHKNKHFLVSRANCDHPLWSVDQNVAFRIVHDVLGHSVAGGDFGWQGENLACAAHFPLLSPTAQIALFTECIAQTAYAAYYRSFGPQKIAAFPEFLEAPQGSENPKAHQGIHPSQSVAPTSMPAMQISDPAPTPYEEQDDAAPHLKYHTDMVYDQPMPKGITPLSHHKVSAEVLADPNDGWQSGIQPLDPTVNVHPVTGQPMGNAYLHHGDPFEADKVRDTASLIDTQWWTKPEATQKLAIVNAFRVVLLSPRKDLRWNAVHYQDISGIPADEKDPKVYWDTLEKKRQEWNVAQTRAHYQPDVDQGRMTVEQADEVAENARFAHQAWRKLWPQFFYVFQTRHQLRHHEAQSEAERLIMNWTTEEQTKLELEEKDVDPKKQMSQDEIERKAQAAMVLRMEKYIEEHQPSFDVLSRVSKDNYVDALAKKIMNECSEDEIPDGYGHEEVMTLFREYALLAMTVGKDVTPENVHDAWSAWQAEHDPNHKSLKPFKDLTKKIKDYDKPYAEYIRKHAFDSYLAKKPPPPRPGDEGMFNMAPEFERPKIVKYGAFMGGHLKAIAQISGHVDAILSAALEDLAAHDGAGYHFRSSVLQLNVSGVGPKVCSFAWLLLCPTSSQLATIDTHMCDVLGHDFNKDLNNRDYFRFERELQAGRDAAGYGGVPLGPFQWGMWDYKRTGPGTHQDHSAMAVLNPKDHSKIDWANKALNLKADDWHKQAPDWWQNTEPARESVRDDWNDSIAKTVKIPNIPYQVTNETLAHFASHKATAKTGSAKEFHVGFTLPEELFEKLAAIADDLPMRKEEPENYHMTAFWSDKGYDRQELHEWISKADAGGFRFYNARIDTFPSNATDDKYAVVLRLSYDGAGKFVESLMDEAEEHELEIRRFPGAWKAHITLGWSDEEVKTQKYPEVEFRSGPLYVSIPRPLREKQEKKVAHVVLGKTTQMQKYRATHPGLSTPEIWKLYSEDANEDPQGGPALSSPDLSPSPTGWEGF